MNVIEQIFGLYERHGSQHYGENASQLQHALQCADLARGLGCTDAMVAAALLHDIGQLMGGAGEAAEQLGIDARHEITGARYLAKHFSPAVCEPVRLHVAAKRYLCAVEPTYAETLSDASILSLRLQGGPMSADEVAAFETEPFFQDAVTLRRFDDDGKQPERSASDLASHRPLLEGLLASVGN